MRDPRWIKGTFAAFIHVISAARFTRAAAQLTLVVALLAAVVLWQPSPDPKAALATVSEMHLPLAGVETNRIAQAAAPVAGGVEAAAASGSADKAAAAGAARVEVATAAQVKAIEPKRIDIPVKVAAMVGPKLDLEQYNLANFIARRYKIALDNTEVFVDGAYRAAKDNKLDPWLLLAVMAVESSFDPSAASNAGAHGLMQVLTKVHAEKFAPFGGVAAAFDPVANIKVGARILREYIARDGSVESGLKSYVGSALMDDDSGYGSKVMVERERLAAAATGKKMPPPPALPKVLNAKADPDAAIDAAVAATRPMQASVKALSDSVSGVDASLKALDASVAAPAIGKGAGAGDPASTSALGASASSLVATGGKAIASSALGVATAGAASSLADSVAGTVRTSTSSPSNGLATSAAPVTAAAATSTAPAGSSESGAQ